MKKRLVIAVDGPAGAGKSSSSRLLAERLGLTDNQAAAIQIPAWIDLLFGDTGEKNKSVSQATAALALAKSSRLACHLQSQLSSQDDMRGFAGMRVLGIAGIRPILPNVSL